MINNSIKKALVSGWSKCLLLIIGAGLALTSCGPEPPPIVIPPTGGMNDTTLIEVTELPPLEIPADNPLTVAGVDLGRHLFYDKILSGDQTQACATCHNQANAFTDNEKQFSEGIHGQLGDRNSMPIYNLMWAKRLFWDSRAKDLRELATMPIENPIEMDARVEDVLVRLNNSVMYKDKFKKAFNTDTITKEHLSKALEQFMLTITSDNSKFDKFNRGEVQLTEQELRGFEVLRIKGCFNCHKNSLLHDNESHNTALDKFPTDKGLQGFTNLHEDRFKFRTPSLRNIMVSGPYMHDGRFETIEEVIRFYEDVQKLGNLTHSNNSNAPMDLMGIAPRNRITQQEMEDAKAFLRTLTDHEYLTNPKFSDPF
jgi:cytochrome c peroxidase